MNRTLTLQEFKTIVENSPNLIWRAGLDAKCNYFNRTWLAFTGRTWEQEYGDGWAEGVHPEDVERCFQTYIAHFNQRTALKWNTVCSGRTASGAGSTTGARRFLMKAGPLPVISAAVWT
ncbi:MAG TPA: PAS domain-containing protein [Candidatus Limiplasma sp.]|nr:PAS domain-containing protein [Candidatus Limiplasma sp.]HPS82229.1 PAS domain-containing protein [Candidatus Limiplasma sp.]